MGNKIISTCKNNEHFPKGRVIGVNNNIVAYGECPNCYKRGQEMSIMLRKAEIESIEDEYVGYRWQCVEYTRRWLIMIKGVTYASINCAYMIFKLDRVKDIRKQNTFYSFLSFENDNSSPPEYGDLIIYPMSCGSPFGHVAVVTNVDLENGFVEVSEQNYSEFSSWDDVNSYSRRVVLHIRNNKYILTDKKWGEVNQLKINYDNEKKKVIGWKRVSSILL